MTDSGRLDQLNRVSQAAAGDRTAQLWLVEHLRPRLRSLCLSLVANRADAEDALQASLLEILASTGSFRGDNLNAWADRITIRTAIRLARQHRVRAARFELDPDLDERPSLPPPSGPRETTARPLVDYLAELPETRRTVLVLRHVLEYSIAEIAELLELSPNTVKDRLLMARGELRRRIRRDLAWVAVPHREGA